MVVNPHFQVHPKDHCRRKKLLQWKGEKHTHVESKLNKMPKMAIVLRSLQVQTLTDIPVFSYQMNKCLKPDLN